MASRMHNLIAAQRRREKLAQVMAGKAQGLTKTQLARALQQANNPKLRLPH